MKALLSLTAGLLAIFFSMCVFACGDSDCSQNSGCASGAGWSCDCADPACRQDNPCLSTSKCCAAFGNIGSIDGFPND